MQKKWFARSATAMSESRFKQTGARSLWGLGTALLFSVAATSQAAAASPLASSAQAIGVEIWPVLLPLLAAAIAVERAIELGWNYIEWILVRFLRWQPSDLKSPSYVQFKSGTSLLAGLFLGVLVANYSGMHLLSYLQPAMPAFLSTIPASWDIILTGIVIGAASKPTHDILGFITHLKNLTASSALKQREQAGAALAEGILKLNQADSPFNVEVPGVGVTRVGAAARGRAAEDAGSSASSEERIRNYADVIHDKLYIGS